MLDTIQDFLGQALLVVVVGVCVYGWLIQKCLAKNAEVKKAAGAKVVSMLLKWLK